MTSRCVDLLSVPEHGILFHSSFGRNQGVAQSNPSLLHLPWFFLFTLLLEALWSSPTGWRAFVGLGWIRCWSFLIRRLVKVSGGDWGLEVTVMSKLAFYPKPTPSVLPVGHTHPFSSYLRGFGLHCEGDMFLQGAELLICLGLERIGKHTAVRAGI